MLRFSLIVRKVPLFRPSFALSQYSDGLNISFSNFSTFFGERQARYKTREVKKLSRKKHSHFTGISVYFSEYFFHDIQGFFNILH